MYSQFYFTIVKCCQYRIISNTLSTKLREKFAIILNKPLVGFQEVGIVDISGWWMTANAIAHFPGKMLKLLYKVKKNYWYRGSCQQYILQKNYSTIFTNETFLADVPACDFRDLDFVHPMVLILYNFKKKRLSNLISL